MSDSTGVVFVRFRVTRSGTFWYPVGTPLVRCSDTLWELRIPHNSVISTVFDSFWEVDLPLTSFVTTVVGLRW